MKIFGKVFFLLVLLAIAVGSNYGCKPAPPCETSLVTLDETRLDAETFEKEAAETDMTVEDLETKLAKKLDEVEEIKDDPEKLAKKLHELKKGSGRE